MVLFGTSLCVFDVKPLLFMLLNMDWSMKPGDGFFFVQVSDRQALAKSLLANEKEMT